MSLAEDRWLSEQIGKPVFRLTGEPPESLPAGFVYTKVRAGDPARLRSLQERGFQLVDTAAVFESPLPLLLPADRGTDFRMATPRDKEALLRIAREAFVYDRFHADPAIPKDVADRLKEAWLANYFSGKRGDWLVVGEAGGVAAGFLLLLQSDEKLVIDLIAVAQDQRGAGIARGMIAFAAASFPQSKTMQVGTQIANIPSIRLYERLGFRMVDAQHILHCHQ